jgi:4Fe-4S ferredoxin
MAFALHVNMDRYPGHNNRVVVCPVDALEFFTVDPAKTSEIAVARHGESAVLDSEQELCAKCGECVEVHPHDAIRSENRGAAPGEAYV